MIQPHKYFEPIVGKRRRNNRVAAFLMLAVSIGAGIWGFSPDAGQYPDARMATVAIICIPVALLILLLSLRPHRGLESLSEPSSIVWYYGVRKGGHVNAVMIGFDDGKLFRFPLPLISIKQGFSQEAFEHLRVAARGAAAGFSEDRRKAFKADPGSLRS